MPRPNSFIVNLGPQVHGGPGFASIDGRNPDRLLDFSTCCNPYPPPAAIRRSLRTCEINRYPDPEAMEFIKTLACKLEVDPSNIIAGSGSTELIRMTAIAYFNHTSIIILPSPTYGEYELACRLVNAGIVNYPLHQDNGFSFNAGDFIDFARPFNPSGIFICNPNNPTGQYISKEEIKDIIDAFPEALITIDEAYISFTANRWNSLSLINKNNLIILRSMTKDFALAGLRVGYAVAHRQIIEILKKVRPPWNICSTAQNAGTASLKCDDYLTKCCRFIEKSRDYLIRSLTGLGYSIPPTSTNFFLVKTGNATQIGKKLLEMDMLVRDCTSFGLPDYIRIAPRSMHDCQKLVEAFKKLKRESI